MKSYKCKVCGLQQSRRDVLPPEGAEITPEVRAYRWHCRQCHARKVADRYRVLEELNVADRYRGLEELNER